MRFCWSLVGPPELSTFYLPLFKNKFVPQQHRQIKLKDVLYVAGTMEALQDRVKSLTSFRLHVLLLLHLLTWSIHGYTLSNDQLNDDMYSTESDEDAAEITKNVDVSLTENKRAQFSLNGELRSLAEMLYDPEQEQKAYNRATLLKLGKRNWRFPLFRFGSSMSGDVFSRYPIQPNAQILRRRSQQLSVSGPLSALANMLAAEGRRRQQSESTHNQMRLLELGKRSERPNNGKTNFEYN